MIYEAEFHAGEGQHVRCRAEDAIVSRSGLSPQRVAARPDDKPRDAGRKCTLTSITPMPEQKIPRLQVFACLPPAVRDRIPST